MAQSEFHFSPRPNRAAEIDWHSWNDDTFAKAKAADKPILLAISAVWCHWCHVMDETSYSDPLVIGYLNDRFIPVRVDNDRRPDVNARYNMGGWPTTAVLTPEGMTLTGATYLPPDQMLRMVREIDAFYHENKTLVANRVASLTSKPKPPSEPAAPVELRASMVERIVAELGSAYDPEYGGFGTQPKFPQTDALELLLLEYRVSGEQRLYEIVAKTVLGMSRGGMYDHVEGGFFRYSTTRDWSVPHFEKMAEDHAGLLRVLSTLLVVSNNPEFRPTLKSATGYIMTTLRDKTSGLFGGSQDADETYFALPRTERKTYQAPYVDRTSYSNWTAALAGAFFGVAAVLEDSQIAAAAAHALDTLHENLRDEDGLLYHFVVPGGTPQIRGLLTDQAAYLRALLDAHGYTGERRFFERARALADAIQTRLGTPEHGYYDHAALQGELGNLVFKDRPLHDNALLADSLLRLSALCGEPQYRQRAEDTLTVYANTYAKAGSFAASYARAVRRYVSEPSVLTIAGNIPETQEFREVAARLPDPLLCVQTVDPRTDARPAGAYLCRGAVCAAPVLRASELGDAFAAIR
ncbi:MAG: DUF255 domain-containing protein [Candidatus Eremiobacteraeota bacterium]|nr:DUF255 domain-containing protein [Candidatus Eremiobacteraeota bacterium]